MSSRKHFSFLGIKAYEKLKRSQKNIKATDDKLYTAAAGAYSFLLGPHPSKGMWASKGLLKVLQDMMSDGFEPHVKMCRSILSAALRCGEYEVQL